jgi:hypothetical protein
MLIRRFRQRSPACLCAPSWRARLGRNHCTRAASGIHSHLMQRKSDAMNALIAGKLSTIKQLSR